MLFFKFVYRIFLDFVVDLNWMLISPGICTGSIFRQLKNSLEIYNSYSEYLKISPIIFY